MIIVFRKSQLALFDTPVHVAQHVRKDGVIVGDHIRIQKKATAKPPAAAPRRSKLDAFIAKHGGEKELGRTLANLSEGQQQRLFAEMARLDGITPEQVADRFGDIAAAAPAPQAAAPAAAPHESDQDRSHREWLENWNRVSGAEDLNAIAPGDIRRAINFASHQVARLGPGKAWDGDEDAKKLIETYNREIGNLEFHLKHRGEAATVAPTPAKAKAAPTVDVEALSARVTRYASGLSRAKDFQAAGHGSHPVGVDVGQLSGKAMEALADMIVNKKVPVFVDSGAYSLHRARDKKIAAGEDVEPLDFEQILSRYDRLNELIGDKNQVEDSLPKPILVMPDVMGDQKASLELLQKHAKWISVEASFDVSRPLVPMVGGKDRSHTLTEYYDAAVAAIGTDRFIVGIPAVSNAWSKEDVTAFLRDRKPRAVHFLGALHEKRLNPWLQAAAASGVADGIEITADANPLRSAILPRDGTKLAPGERSKKITKKLGAPAGKRELEKIIASHGGIEGVRKMLAAEDFEGQQRFIGLASDLSGTPQSELRLEYGLGEGPVEGDQKTENGITYELRNGRWNRVTPEDEAAPEAAAQSELQGSERLVLMACGAKKKDGTHPASELYTGALPGVLNKWAPKGAARPDIAIISAKHGLVHGDTPIESYDQRMTPARAKELAAQPADLAAFQGRAYKEVFIAGGADYREVADAYVKQLRAAGIVTADAKVSATKGEIGEIRSQFGQYLRSIQPKPGAEPAPADAAGEYEVKRVEREATDDYGKAGKVEWHVVDRQWGNGVEVWPTKKQAAEHARSLNEAKPDAPARAQSPAAGAAPHDPATPFGVRAGIGKPERRELNGQAIARMEQGGPYSPADLDLLRQYSGNGGCGDSLNEYYTDPDVARAMWTALRNLGAAHGTFLEPSVGTGVFMHTAPEGFKGTGVELDPVSANVAQALHGDRHEVHTASLERFATMDDRQFDVVIGNPPYGPRGRLAKDDKKNISSAEDYFVDTSIDKASPGGIIALVVPTGILDSKSRRAAREGILCRAEFLGALRMPNTAFEHSHTEVTTDVVFLRKRPDDVGRALVNVKVNDGQKTLQDLGVWDEEFIAGSYFTGRGAKNVLGTMGPGWRAQAGMGDDITVNGSMVGVPESIAEFTPDSESRGALSMTVQDVLQALPEGELRDRALAAAQRPRAYENTAKVGDQKTVDGVTYILQGDPPRWHRVDEFLQSSPAITQAQDLAAEIDRLVTGAGAVDRPALEEAVKAYVKEHGIPADNPDLMTAAMADKKLYRLVGAVDRKGNLSDAVSGRAARAIEGGFDATAETMALERDTGRFTAAELAERLGKPAEEVEDQLAADSRYASLGIGWTTMDLYLTGDLWSKLDAARAQLEVSGPLTDKLRDQVARLEKAIDPKSLEDVEVQVNSAFLPVHVLEAYFDWRQYDSPKANEWTKKQAKHQITFADGIYRIEGGNTWGDAKLLGKYLNRTGIRQEEDLPEIEKWNQEFKEWLCTSPYRDQVEDLYNRKFRGYVARKFSDAPIDVPGLAAERGVRPWRWDSLRNSLATGKGIIADDVGLGKTLGGLLLARMAKIQGTAKRPVIVVPKSVLANWYAEANAWFPGSRVLSIGANFAYDKNGELVGRDDDATERKRKYHDLTQNDYDFILISEPSFEEVDLDPITKEQYYGQDFWVQRGEALGNAGDKRRKAIREKYEQALAQREFQAHTDAIHFNELGVDMLIADEMHHQKNLYAAKARFGESPKFLGGQGLSNRALDFNLKTRWVRENNNGKGVYGLTATPTKNSPLEIYSMLSHIAPEAFENIGIRNSEEFLDRFCVFERDMVLNTKGEIEEALVVSGFKNLNELRPIMTRYIDRRTADQVGLKLPERQQRMHLIDMTPAQQDVYAELRALAEESSGKKDATGDSHIFSIMDKMNKAALDLELLGRAEHTGASSPKYGMLAEQVAEGAKEGGQLVFSEYIDSHDKIARALVDAGIPRNQIGIINAQVASSAVKRQNIADALNKGKLKVVIGNCTMAEGLNMQKTTTDIHELDIPWEPATVQQRLGRGIRQGNLNEAVRTHSYLAKGSFDGYRYQAVHAKRDWMDLLWNGGDRIENLAREGAFSLDDMRIMLAADPEAARAEFAKDKAAATQRFEAGARADAQEQYVKFTELSRSFGALKNKDGASARRLRQRLESAKTTLFNNKYWPDKGALDHAGDVLLDPKTGTVLRTGQGVHLGDDGKSVVTGVNMRAGTVTLRKWAATGGSHAATMPVKELESATFFDHNQDEENAEVERQLMEAAASKLNSIEKWEDIASMPTAVVDANRDLIQGQVKAAAKAYKFTFPHGTVPMVNKETGKIDVVEDYGHRDRHETHDYLLPTSDAVALAQQGWIDARRSAKVGRQFFAGHGKRSKSYYKAARKYEGARYDSQHRNPLHSVLARLGGEQTAYGQSPRLVKEAKARLEAEQNDRIRRAKSAKEVIHELVPLGAVSGQEEGYTEGKFSAKYPKKALTLAWARARHLGELHKPVVDALASDQNGAGVDFQHDWYAIAGHKDKSVHHALAGMAMASGHRDLAEAMIEADQSDPQSQSDPKETVRLMGQGWGGHHSARGLRQMLRAAEEAGVADQTLAQLSALKLRDAFAAPSTYGYGYGASSKSLREKINELMPKQETEEAA